MRRFHFLGPTEFLCALATVAAIAAAVNSFTVSAQYAGADAVELSAARQQGGLLWLAVAVVSLVVTAALLRNRLGRPEGNGTGNK